MHTYVYAHAHTLTHFLSLSLFAYARCLLDVIVMDLTLLALSYLIVCSVALAGFSHTLHQKKKRRIWWEKLCVTIIFWSMVNALYNIGKLKFCSVD